jgi:hypothetical protein
LDGGVFIIDRNRIGRSGIGSIYRKAGDTFSLLRHSGDCEVEPMILEAAT